MPLSQDDRSLDYGGSWGDASKDWPAICFRSEEEAKEAFVAAWRVVGIPYGSYVLVGMTLRLETTALKKRFEQYLAVERYLVDKTVGLTVSQPKEEGVNMSKQYVVMFWERDNVHAEVLEREEFLKRITPKQGDTDTYYGGDYGISFVDSVAELDRSREAVLGPMRLLVFEVGKPVKPVKVETVTHYHID